MVISQEKDREMFKVKNLKTIVCCFILFIYNKFFSAHYMLRFKKEIKKLDKDRFSVYNDFFKSNVVRNYRIFVFNFNFVNLRNEIIYFTLNI